MFSGLNISASGLTAQRKRMNAIASNLANAETTRTEGGGPYRRKIVLLKAKGEHLFGSVLRQAGLRLSATNEGHITSGGFPEEQEEGSTESISATEAQDQSAPKTVYDPGNPDADENGYVKMPNVNVVTEMVSMMSASQAFEANVVAIDAAKNMAKDSLEI
ncbi:MAG TPA: flagellar basal body rod protein FlgC [Bacteroidota bacterium]|nr:flagellar basal body rod protein FlgC [Bacteroidota bacterium]